MPKKFKGENTKSTDARSRKAAALHEAEDKRQKDQEDAYWADDDKHVARKQQRKDDKEKKHQEVMKNKLEKQELFDQELAAIKPAKPPPSAKVTRAQITQNRKQAEKEAAAAQKKEETPVNELPLEENLNRLVIEGEARGVEEAIDVLSKNPGAAVDMHPEKRVKAAYAAFEDVRLPQLKADNPNLRLSQLKQMLKKEWQKSPDNPINQR